MEFDSKTKKNEYIINSLHREREVLKAGGITGIDENLLEENQVLKKTLKML